MGKPLDSELERDRLLKLLKVSEALYRIQDLDAVLDHVLVEACEFTNSDCGTIYLVEGDKLRFAYNAQSGKLVPQDPSAAKRRYLDHTMPLNSSSTAGYVALNGEAVVIDDAYRLSSDCAYSFNPAYDQQTGYRTTSMFTVPLKADRDETVGVMQLINALDPHGRSPIPFAETDRLYATLLSKTAAMAIGRATATRSTILRMIRMAELRDPTETGPHVNRVGAYSVEIYQRWAERRGISSVEIERNRDKLRLGTMMHDVGKIATPDAILRKPGPLTNAERALMQQHTVLGARLFATSKHSWTRSRTK